MAEARRGVGLDPGLVLVGLEVVAEVHADHREAGPQLRMALDVDQVVAEREAVLVGERDDELIREGARHEIRDALALLDAVAEQEAVAEESDVDVGEREVAVFPEARLRWCARER